MKYQTLQKNDMNVNIIEHIGIIQNLQRLDLGLLDIFEE
jgi:hypothetical protein